MEKVGGSNPPEPTIKEKVEIMDLSVLRHSCSHIMAEAVKALWPQTKLGIGPSIEDGFYYDFDKKDPFTDEDLLKVEEKMREIIAHNASFFKTDLTKKGEQLFRKAERIDLIPSASGERGFILILNKTIAFYFYQEHDHFRYDGFETGEYDRGEVTIFDHFRSRE